MNTDSISASEVAEFVYCKRAWWLRKNRNLSTSMAMLQGILEHDALAAAVKKVGRNIYLILTALLVCVGLLLLALSYFLSQ